MALSEVCSFENDEIPIINIYGNRNAFRPLLYFKEHDVLLTTTSSCTFYHNQHAHVTGLALFHILFQLHRCPVKKDQLQRLSKTGWKPAKSNFNPKI